MKKLASIIFLSFFLISCYKNESLSLENEETVKISSKTKTEANRDWKTNPAIINIDTTQDIFSIGDIHGDYDNFLKALKGAKLIDGINSDPSKIKWLGGKVTLVCTGDMIDKWTNSLKVIELMKNLHDQAISSGGQVIVTMGNHEAEFLADPNNDKAVDFVTELKAQGINPADIASGENPVGKYLRSLPFGAKIGKWFFCHAGNTDGKTLSQLTNDLQKGIDSNGFGDDILANPNSIVEARLSPSPWWEKNNKPEETLTAYETALGVEHIVMGHQPGKVVFLDGTTRERGVLYQKYGKIFLTDVGMSQGVDNNQGVLLKIHSLGTKTSVTGIYADGHEVNVWKN